MRIVWTKDEKRALKECMIDICYVTPMMSNKGLFKAAQEEVIPYERRTKVTDQRVFNYKVLINEARAAAEKHRQAVNKPKSTPTPPPVIAPEPVKKLDTLGEVFELFIDALADRIMAKLAASQPIEAPEPERMHDDRLDAAFFGGRLMDQLKGLSIRKPVKVKRTTALIVGLNGCQMETIKAYKPDIDFTFVTAEQAVSMHAFNKDHTILMTKFINHSAQGKYRKHPNLHYCNGGVSDLKHLLHGIFHKGTV